MNAADPMTGGMAAPPVEAATSTAPAKRGEYPSRFMIGMVMDPVVATSEVGLPEIIPYMPDDMTAILAGPPGERPVSAAASWNMNSAPPA